MYYPEASFKIDPNWADDQVDFIYEHMIFDMRMRKITLSLDEYEYILGLQALNELGNLNSY